MKKLFSVKTIPWLVGAAFVLTLTLTLPACKKEKQIDEPVKTEVKQVSTESHSICFPVFYYTIGRPIFNCGGWWGLCKIWRWKCIPLYIEWPPHKWWDIRDLEILRKEIYQYGKIPSLVKDIESPKEQFTIIPINEQIVMIQMYEPKQKMLDENTFILKEGFDLGKEFAEEFHLKGSAIDAGKYPVVFDKENGTYNVLVNVK